MSLLRRLEALEAKQTASPRHVVRTDAREQPEQPDVVVEPLLGPLHAAVSDPLDLTVQIYWRRISRGALRGDWVPERPYRRKIAHVDGLQGPGRAAWLTDYWASARTAEQQMLAEILGDVDAAALRYARLSGRCMRCAKSLTDAFSMRFGYGPECRRKLGLV